MSFLTGRGFTEFKSSSIGHFFAINQFISFFPSELWSTYVIKRSHVVTLYNVKIVTKYFSGKNLKKEVNNCSRNPYLFIKGKKLVKMFKKWDLEIVRFCF